MTTVLLRLEGPLQSWATQSQFGVRDTDREPSKSGVIGLCAAALGVERDDTDRIKALADLEFAIRIDRPGILLRDYHTAGGGTFRKDKGYSVHGIKKGQAITSDRYYLQDASFLAALAGPQPVIEEISKALQNPRWPLFLGRRACPPGTPVFESIVEHSPLQALTQSPRAAERSREQRSSSVRIVVECNPSEGDPRHDVPLSFFSGDRRYGVRYVQTKWVNPPHVKDTSMEAEGDE